MKKYILFSTALVLLAGCGNSNVPKIVVPEKEANANPNSTYEVVRSSHEIPANN